MSRDTNYTIRTKFQLKDACCCNLYETKQHTDVVFSLKLFIRQKNIAYVEIFCSGRNQEVRNQANKTFLFLIFTKYLVRKKVIEKCNDTE